MPTRTGRIGALYHDDDAMAEFFHAAHNAGLQVGVHAIGDRAIEQVLTTWERVYLALDSRERRHFRARRHRIEHFVLPSGDQIERTAMLGLAVSVQPAFDRLWGQGGGMYEERLGPARAMAAHPIRTMLDRGIEVGVGSDTPITPLDPMLAIAALEEHHEPTQRLTRLEALKLHRVGSARLGRQDGKKGALEPGGTRTSPPTTPTRWRSRPSRGSVRCSPSRSGARCSAPDRGVSDVLVTVSPPPGCPPARPSVTSRMRRRPGGGASGAREAE